MYLVTLRCNLFFLHYFVFHYAKNARATLHYSHKYHFIHTSTIYKSCGGPASLGFAAIFVAGKDFFGAECVQIRMSAHVRDPL